MTSLTLINHILFALTTARNTKCLVHTFPMWDLAASRVSLPWIIAAETFSSDVSHSLASGLKVAD